jgi:hypothetical protein
VTEPVHSFVIPLDTSAADALTSIIERTAPPMIEPVRKVAAVVPMTEDIHAQFVIPLDVRPPTITVSARRINAPGLLRGWSALYLATACW